MQFFIEQVLPSVLFGLAFILAWVVVIYVVCTHRGNPQRQSPRRVKTAREAAQELLQKAEDRSDTLALKWLRGAGYAVAPVALPTGAAAVVASNVARAVKHRLALHRERMPDEWYEQVLRDSSEAGKIFLGGKLKKQGYVSVAQAAEWLELESKVKAAADTPVRAAQAELIALHEAKPTALTRLKALLLPSKD